MTLSLSSITSTMPPEPSTDIRSKQPPHASPPRVKNQYATNTKATAATVTCTSHHDGIRNSIAASTTIIWFISSKFSSFFSTSLPIEFKLRVKLFNYTVYTQVFIYTREIVKEMRKKLREKYKMVNNLHWHLKNLIMKSWIRENGPRQLSYKLGVKLK